MVFYRNCGFLYCVAVAFPRDEIHIARKQRFLYNDGVISFSDLAYNIKSFTYVGVPMRNFGAAPRRLL